MRRYLPALVFLASAGVTALVSGPVSYPANRESRAVSAALLARSEERRIREEDIRFFEQRIARDPGGAFDLVRVGGLYLERAREGDDETELRRAEAAARRAIANGSGRDAGGWRILTATLLAQHRFREAVEAARQAQQRASDDAAAAAALGEVLLELGEYPAADSIFRRLLPQRHHPAVAPRQARWLEIRGDPGAARRLLELARAELLASPNPSIAVRAWYELRLGELALRFGARREAARRLTAGLAIAPDDWRLLGARARLALAAGDPAGAVSFGDSALALHLDPPILATVGDALRAQGRPAEAAGYFTALAVMAGPTGAVPHRGWSLALLDHGLRIPEVLSAAEQDLRLRHDGYGHDLHAWALYKSGRYREAREAMARALAVGIQDPEVLERARAISAAAP